MTNRERRMLERAEVQAARLPPVQYRAVMAIIGSAINILGGSSDISTQPYAAAQRPHQ
jgi:hypothetical protein